MLSIPPATTKLESPSRTASVGEPDGGHPREAHLVDRHRGHGHGEPTGDGGLSCRDLPLSGLEHVAEQDLVDCRWIDTGAGKGPRDRHPAQIHGAQWGQGAAVFAYRGAGDSGDDTVAHVVLRRLMLPVAR